MTPEEIGARLVELLVDGAGSAPEGTVRGGVSGGQAYARATVDVPAQRWREAVLAARDDPELAFDFFDWLSAVDELTDGFDVVAHLWSTRHRHGALVRARVPRDAPELPSVRDIYPGADWHERETHEMFGIGFTGRDGLAPLLLPPEFEGHPLRKEFVLASRVAKPWPGAKEPGESESGAARRQPMRPPGVPAPGQWGLAAAAPAGPARRPGTARPARPDRPSRSARPDGSASPARPDGSARPGAAPAEPADGPHDGEEGA
ncbi:NADH-quinone oxidoreductase subunit C [Plantactinospora sp. KBS50]|nr:NADH-quinone oxidoreductase subunit C [Plantactinospora sp. KBS50]ASW53506.1 NADH-quinone oxidoreductase subunit C [Plantactinospora sp. KBS50]